MLASLTQQRLLWIPHYHSWITIRLDYLQQVQQYHNHALDGINKSLVRKQRHLKCDRSSMHMPLFLNKIMSIHEKHLSLFSAKNSICVGAMLNFANSSGRPKSPRQKGGHIRRTYKFRKLRNILNYACKWDECRNKKHSMIRFEPTQEGLRECPEFTSWGNRIFLGGHFFTADRGQAN